MITLVDSKPAVIKKKKYNIGIIWANPYNKNLGVGALAYSCLAIFSDILNENGLEGQITLIGSNGSLKDTINIGGKKIEFHNIKGLNFLEWKSALKLVLLPKKYQTLSLFKFDIVFDMAEGDSFSDIYGMVRFNKILNSKRFFNMLGVKQVLLPQTIGPFSQGKVEDSAFAAMKKLERVISRDKKSFEYTAKHLPADKISEAIDVAFYMPFEKQTYNDNKIHVGLNVSGLLWNGGYTRNNQFAMKTDYKELIRSTLSYFNALPNVQIHLVSHVIPTDQAVEDDFAAAEEIKKEFPAVVLSPKFQTPIEAKSYISGMHFFAGARMHACIAAFSSGVPVFPMAYSRKFNGLFGETLQYSWYGDCINEKEDTILENLKESFYNRELLKEKIKESNAKIVAPRLIKLKEQLLESIINA